MKLYYSPGACSLAPHIVLQELGLPYEYERVDLKAHKTESGKDFYAINPKGYVPAIALDNGELLTETVAMLLYLAAQKPEKKLAVQPGEKDFLRQLDWLLFITTEIHKGLGTTAFMLPNEEAKAVLRGKLAKRLDYIEAHLATHSFILGNDFSVADAYLFTVLNWAKPAAIDLAKWPAISAYHATIGARPAVITAMQKEGLRPAKAA